MRYFKKKTGMGFYDNILKNPNYHRKEKGLRHKIVHITPDKFIEECARRQKSTIRQQHEMIYPKPVRRYKKRTLKGSPMPMPVLGPEEDYQEGRHRAMVAKELGIKKIPVLKVWRE